VVNKKNKSKSLITSSVITIVIVAMLILSGIIRTSGRSSFCSAQSDIIEYGSGRKWER